MELVAWGRRGHPLPRRAGSGRNRQGRTAWAFKLGVGEGKRVETEDWWLQAMLEQRERRGGGSRTGRAVRIQRPKLRWRVHRALTGGCRRCADASVRTSGNTRNGAPCCTISRLLLSFALDRLTLGRPRLPTPELTTAAVIVGVALTRQPLQQRLSRLTPTEQRPRSCWRP